jgi:hypothetical protein
MTVATNSALAVSRCNHSDRSHPPTRLDLILKRLEIKPETNMSRPGTEPGSPWWEASRVLELVSQISS